MLYHRVFARPGIRNINGIIGISLATLIIFLQFNAGFHISQTKPEIFGCDPFGYSRQARLFRTSKDIPQALNTDLPESVYQDIKSWADSTTLDSSEWYQMVAPHCHHFRDTSGLIINQYPFGTGWLLSFIPEEQSRRWLVILSLVIISVINIFKIMGEKTVYQQILRAFNVWVLFKIIEEFWTRSDSVSPSIVAAIISAEIALRFSDSNFLSSPKKYIYSLILGLLLGFSICLRPGNLFFSYAAILCLILAITSRQLKKIEITRIALIGSLGYLPGVLMNSYFNWINTGAPLRTTYTINDTSFSGSFSTVANNIQKINTEKGDLLLFISTCILLISIAHLTLISRRKSDRLLTSPTIICLSIAWISLASFTILCISKNVFISYYLATQVAFASSLICCGSSPAGSVLLQPRNIAGQRKLNAFTTNVFTTSLILISLLIGINNLSTTDEVTLTKNPLPLFNPNNSLLWGDSAGSYLYWHYGLPTAKILFGSREAQADAINYLQSQGVHQYIMDENDLLSKLSHIEQIQNIGLAGDFRGIKIYRLNN
jgi:hypothetical protein